MKKYSYIMMAFALLLGMAQCKKEPATPNGDNNGGVRITLKVDDGPSTPSTGSGTESGTDDGEKLNVYPATGAVIFTQGDKIYVGNNGKYVGTLTFDNGLFQGTVSGDLSTDDYLHFYFVGNKPTSPATLAASITSYTVDISDQSAGLPAISYAPSTAKYSSSTTAYTAKLLNKSALVKFVPSMATSQPITVSGLYNEVQIDFANHTLAPTGNTGGITLFSAGDSEKWAILLEQASLSGLTVSGSGFEATIEETTLPNGITNNMYYNSGIGIAMTATYKIYEANNSNWASVLASFNSESTPNPMLIVKTDISGNCTITREDGTIDFSNHSLSGALFLQNNVLNQTVTVRNGSVERVDGKDGTGDLYNGTVIFDNMTVRSNVATDAHHYIVQGGTYGVASSHVFEQPYANAPYPALTEIYDGKFMKLAIQYGSGTATTYRLYGGKYKNRPNDAWCAPGYTIKLNTDNDAATYPWIVSADAPVVSYPEGAINGKFTINSNGDQVYFSQGNLQYKDGTGWRFAEHQYDYAGTWNTSDWVDLFGWGTWGEGKNPLNTSTNNADYTWSTDFSGTLTNANSTGWRTMTYDEWNYLLYSRQTGVTINGTDHSRYTKATINTDGTSKNGLIIFPDNYSGGTPDGVTWGTINPPSNSQGWGTSCTTAGWRTMEEAGCVFLPTSGERVNGTTVQNVSTLGLYWYSTSYDSNYAWYFVFHNNDITPDKWSKYRGCSVRLVCPAD